MAHCLLFGVLLYVVCCCCVLCDVWRLEFIVWCFGDWCVLLVVCGLLFVDCQSCVRRLLVVVCVWVGCFWLRFVCGLLLIVRFDVLLFVSCCVLSEVCCMM